MGKIESEHIITSVGNFQLPVEKKLQLPPIRTTLVSVRLTTIRSV